MAQVVRPQGIVGPIVLLVIGVILLFNAVPAAFEWIGWIARMAFLVGVESAIETALIPLGLALGGAFVGFLMVRGGWGALRRAMRGAGRRARDQVRGGVQQVRSEAERRYEDTQAQMRQAAQGASSSSSGNATPQSWRERIEAVARETEAARRQGSQQPWMGQGQQVGQGQQMGQGQQPWQGQGEQRPPQQRPQQVPQQQRPVQPPQPQAAPPRPVQQAPGADRLARIEQLRAQVGDRARRAMEGDDARRTAQRAREAADRVVGSVRPDALGDDVAALVGRLDVADAERMRRRGTSLTSRSLSTSSLARTSLTLDSLRQHRR